MKTLTLHDGTTIPALGLGTWKSKPGEVYEAVKVALQAGYRHLDCAAIYGNEAEVGAAIRESLDAGVLSRDELWVTSKLWNDCHAPEHVQPALEATLADLQLDAVDLYLIHWPVVMKHGVRYPSGPDDFLSLDEVPLARTWEAMTALVPKGLARHVGVSNFSAAKMREVTEATGKAPAMNQVELHPYLQQWDLLEAARALGTLVTGYSPLGSPDSAPLFEREDDDPLLDNDVVKGIAAARDATPAQVLIAWAITRGTVSIPKSTNPGRIRENLAAAAVSLTDDDMAALRALDRHQRQLDGALWIREGTHTYESLWDEARPADAPGA